ncbi:MAG: methyltransferase domain-containing protein [Candidatus Rokubacteria bacterium]|nr:methyltransferase domain-containing protein [Candidatus Rokubacteria bacterium]
MASLPRAADARELLDAPGPFPGLEENLRDLARLNRLFGGAWLIRAHVARLLEGTPADWPVTILDVGTGGADLPMAVVRWARRSGRPMRVLALDKSHEVLSVARRLAAGYPEIVFLQADGLSLPLKREAVDVVLLSLTLHHVEPAEASALLAELNRTARRGFVVNDLIRNRLAYGLVWLATRIFATSRIARHDGPLSVLRAYTPTEILDLAQRAGLPGIRIVCYPWLARLAVVGRKR